MRLAIERRESSLFDDRIGQIAAFTSQENGFSTNDVERATHPRREVCGSGVKSRTNGMPVPSNASSSYEGQLMTSRMTPTIKVAAAIISDASGVKSAVSSMRC